MDHYPAFSRIAAFSSIVFELGFIFLIFHPRARYFAVFSGACFHILVYMSMNIRFFSMLGCYVVFFDWYKIYFWTRKQFFNIGYLVSEEGVPPAQLSALKKSVIIPISAILVLGNFYFGLHAIDSWPFAVYPTFAKAIVQPYETRLSVVFYDDSGAEIPLKKTAVGRRFAGRYGGMMRSILAIEDEERQRRKFAALWRFLSEQDASLDRVVTIRFYRIRIDLRPQNWHLNPVEQELIVEMQPARM